MTTKLLLVEDDLEMRRATRMLLDRAGYRVSEAGSAEEALVAIEKGAPDLLVSDIQLPGLSGVKLCEILRGQPRTAALPVILLTVMSRSPDKVRGLQTGADDYITKPYEPREFLARIETLLRRVRQRSTPEETLVFQGLRVDLTRREVILNNRPISLRRKEYELLLLFLRHPGQLLTRDRVSKTLWNDDVIVTDNAISVHIRQLRARLGRFGDRIQTLVGEGYRLDDSE
ncbi:MAG: response regulator transcription factor [Elusimicrobia bacterium]|nr:response regulator transcription factor [Elusimicrobiota bacterium]